MKRQPSFFVVLHETSVAVFSQDADGNYLAASSETWPSAKKRGRALPKSEICIDHCPWDTGGKLRCRLLETVRTSTCTARWSILVANRDSPGMVDGRTRRLHREVEHPGREPRLSWDGRWPDSPSHRLPSSPMNSGTTWSFSPSTSRCPVSSTVAGACSRPDGRPRSRATHQSQRIRAHSAKPKQRRSFAGVAIRVRGRRPRWAGGHCRWR